MSNLQALTVPKWGMSMEEGEIAEWRVAVGDSLSIGDEFVDIETSKIVNTAECSAAGTLVRIIAQTGETHLVGSLLGVVADGEASEADNAQNPVAVAQPASAPSKLYTFTLAINNY